MAGAPGTAVVASEPSATRRGTPSMTRSADGSPGELGLGSPTLAERASAALVAYRAGSTDELAALVRDASPLLWRVVRAQGVGRSQAEDVVQGVWLALVRNAEAIRDPDAVLGWLLVSARRAGWRAAGHERDDARRRTPLPEPGERPADEPRAVDPLPEQPVLDAERDSTLWRAFLRLPQRCQQILRFVATADRPDYKAIAEATGMKVTAVGITRGRCLAKLRTELDHEGWLGA